MPGPCQPVAVPTILVSEAPPTFENGPDFVQSLSRGLMVMRAFDADHAELSQSEIAERTGLARAVVRRSLLTLQHLSYVGARGRRFFLTPRVLELGFGYLSSLRLPELARPGQATYLVCSIRLHARSVRPGMNARQSGGWLSR